MYTISNRFMEVDYEKTVISGIYLFNNEYKILITSPWRTIIS